MRWLSLTLVFGAMATLFTNCGTFDDAATFSTSLSSVSCDDADCVTPTVNNLSLRANLSGTTEFRVPVGLADFDIGGDCNEGGFLLNTIRWELYLNNIKVRDSNMAGSGGPGLASNSTCINGRFRVYVNLGSITGDAVNRTGLSTGGTVRAPYDLWIQIYGQESSLASPQFNTIKGRTRISLIPVATL